MLDRLKELDLYDGSLIIFAADHGEEFRERSRRVGHSGSLHDELVNVPLLVKLPGNRHQEVNTPVSLVDVYPTILSVLGLSIDHPVVGQDLKPGRGSEASPEFFETARGKTRLQGVVFQHFKLIQNSTSIELYDLNADPGEINNIAEERPEILADLGRLLEDWIASVKPGAPIARGSLASPLAY